MPEPGLFLLFQSVPVSSFKPVAGCEGEFTLVVLPDLVVLRRPGKTAKLLFNQNIALFVAIEFDVPGFLSQVESI